MLSSEGKDSSTPWVLAAMAMALVAYGPALRNEFTYDDWAVIKENPGLPALVSPHVYFSSQYFRLSGENTYRPAVTASYALDYSVWGLNSFGYRLQNLLWHCAGCAALFFACRSLGATREAAAIGAALYAAHPIQSEAVCSAGFREDLMCAFFFLAAFALWPAWPARRAWPTARTRDFLGRESLRLAGAIGCFVFALLSKEMALSLPLAVMAKDWRARRLGGDGPAPRWRSRAPRYAAVWLVAFAAFALFLLFRGPEPNASEPATAPFLSRVMAFPVISLRYLKLLVLPYPLRLEYEFPMRGTWFWLSSLGSGIALIALGTWLFVSRRLFPAAWESFVAFFILLGPVSNLIPLSHPMAERYVTLPSAAFCWAVGGFVAGLQQPRLKRAVLGAVLVACVVLSWVRVYDWRSQMSLWEAEIRHGSDTYLAHYNYGLALAERGRRQEAIGHLAKAVAMRPDSPDAHAKLGLALARLGQSDQALAQYAEALRLNPVDSDTLCNLGTELLKRGQTDEAAQHLREAIAIEPGHAIARNNLGSILQRQGKIDDAIVQYSEAVRAKPDYAIAHFNLACLLRQRGQIEPAIEHFAEAARWNPGYAEAHYNLGVLLKEQGKRAEAAEQFRAALALAQASGDAPLAASIKQSLDGLK